MIDRRRVIIMAGGAAMAAPRCATAQTAGKVYRVGLFTSGAPLVDSNLFVAPLIRGLEKRGYTPGRDLLFERRSAGGRFEDLPQLLAELVASKVDVIFVLGYRPAFAAMTGTTIPVVVISTGDPVGTGLVDSLARPGGHLTGVADMAAELAPKRLQLLKELAPGLRRVAMLWNAGDAGMTLRYRVSEAAAKALGVSVEPLGVTSLADLEPALTAMKGSMPDGMFVVADGLTTANRKVIFDFAATNRLPAMYEQDFLVREGGLMSYGPDHDDSLDHAAAFIDRILKGAKPQDLALEQPTRLRLAINARTARALNLTIPPLLLAQADEVIE